MSPGRKAFALPLVLLLSAGLLVLAVLSLKDTAAEARRERIARIHEETRQRLRLQLPALLSLLEQRLGSPPAASAVLSAEASLLAVAVTPERRRPLYSLPAEAARGGAEVAGFVSERFRMPLQAFWLPLPGEADGPRHSLAFAFEDLGLGSGGDPPAWYPLPGWSHAPLATLAEREELHRNLFPDALPLPLPPGRGELRFLPEVTPPLAPVLREVRLRFGLFAAGALAHREKEVRLRYFMQGVLWNPWNRPLRLYDQNGGAAFARLALTGLPAVRIENRTRGRASGWLALDEAANAHTGKQGLSAWVEGPAVLAPGERLTFTIPDPSRQAEGLARTVHPAFPVGPADAIQLEWKRSPDGVGLTLLPFAEEDPVAAARAGKGWLRWEAFPLTFPELAFSRADETPGPFFLHGGSLSFRFDSAQIEVQLAHAGKLEKLEVDPRRPLVNAAASYATPAGKSDSGADWIRASVRNLRRKEPWRDIAHAEDKALFSYPEEDPFPGVFRLDQPHRTMPFRLGAPETDSLNRWLDHPAFPGFLAPESASEIPAADPRMPPSAFLPVQPVNAPAPATWRERLDNADRRPEENGLLLSPFLGKSARESLLSVTNEAAQRSSSRLAGWAKADPVPSVAAFHTQGRLPRALSQAGVPADHPAFPLVALRAFAGRAPPLVRHGPAWILHVALAGSEDRITVRHSAKVWFHQVRDAESGEVRFRRMRLQWTDPSKHLAHPELPPVP
ncbi:MAG: hypothetical protein GVY10_02430 [Verrucomicrobia bacterium]|jgi:hypothetical protein|nr:hypothetical protein [Verrucomicrobiota bacterium]